MPDPRTVPSRAPAAVFHRTRVTAPELAYSMPLLWLPGSVTRSSVVRSSPDSSVLAEMTLAMTDKVTARSDNVRETGRS